MQPAYLQFGVSREDVASFCRKHHIRRLALYGSVVRDDFTPQSDIDVLVEFDPEHVPGFAIVRIERELGELFDGREVQLVTFGSLSYLIRDQVLAEAVELYAA
jgi:hypothetical protein